MHTNARIALGLVAALLASPAPARAEAPYCSLRDPAHQIFEMLPAASAYRSVVRVVDAQARDRVAALLPFTLHQRELGRHTLYLGLAAGSPVGIVHVRTEPGPWGLIEIAWALDMDLRVVDFRFQRCRGAGCRELGSDEVKRRLRGLGFSELRSLLSGDASTLSESASIHRDPRDALSIALVRSALKTVAVTRIVWGDSIRSPASPAAP